MWYISQALTDLSILPELLGEWHKDITPKEIKTLILDNDVNIDLIDDEDIPGDYKGNAYEWLANDIEPTLFNAGLITKDKELTDLGTKIVKTKHLFKTILAASIKEQAFYLRFIKLLSRIQHEQSEHYSGLILAEACLVFHLLGNHDDEYIVDLIIKNKRVALDQINQTGVRTSNSEIQLRMLKTITTQLIYEKHTDIKAMDIVRTRATLVWLTALSLGDYEDLFGIQHIAISSPQQEKSNTKQSITVYGKKQIPAPETHKILALANFIHNIKNNNRRGIKGVAEYLGIEILKNKDGTKKDKTIRFNINKALSLELVMTHWLRETDSPVKAQANCEVNKDNKPCSFAPSGYSDAVIYYHDFTLSVEVSAKQNITSENFEEQLKAAIKHSKDNDFCLLVLNASLTDKENFDIYKEIIQDKPVIVLSLDEFNSICEGIDGKGIKERIQMPPSEDIKRIFTLLAKEISLAKSPMEKNQLANLWVKHFNKPNEPEPTNNTKPKPKFRP